MNVKSRILIVDDEPSNVQIIANAIYKEHELLVATSGMQGLKVANNEMPDLILLDIGLPDISGYQVCRTLKNQAATAQIPIIFITARDTDVDELHGLELGAIDYIRKPFSPPLILARVNNQLLLKHKTDQLEMLAMIDGLTGIPNRRLFEDEYRKAWSFAQRKQRELAVAILDIDYFKQFNDHYGHAKGDHCLQLVAKTIANTLHRPLDFVARYGGEEFVVILPDTQVEDAIKVAEKMRNNIADLNIQHEHPDIDYIVTVSIGVATCKPESHRASRKLLEEADKNLYQAKNMGRNRLYQA
jgi:diguanylate cyclase (GGDEF)-like protein